MPRLLPLVLLAGLLAPSAVAADPTHQDVDQWLTHRHASLTKALDSALSSASTEILASKTRVATVPPNRILISAQRKPRLTHTPKI